MAASKFRIASSSFTSDATFSGSVIFNQDVTVSGTLNVYEMKTTLVSSSIIFKSGSTKFGDTADDLHQFTGSVSFSSGLSGSLHHLADGTSYLVAGENITIASSSNGSIAITSTDTNTTYTAGSGLDLAGTEFSLDLKSASGLKITSGELAVEPADFVGTGLEDDGSDNIRINNSVVATISGSTFTGATKHNLGLSGSLHHLVDGTSYLIAGANITIASASNGAVTISGAAGGGGTPGGSNTQVQFNDSGGFGGDAGLVYNKSSDTLTLAGVLIVSGAAEHASDVSLTQNSRLRFNNPGQNDIFIYANSDNALRIDGDDSVDFNADTSFSFTANSNSITVDDTKTIINSGATSADFYANTSNYFGTVFVDGGDNTVILGNQSFDSTPVASEVSGYGTDVKIYISGTVGTKGTSTRGVTLIAGDSIVSGTLYAPTAISGSLTRLTDGTSYLIAGTDITITSASNGSITINSDAASVSSLDDLSDVDLTVSPSDTSILVYDSTASAFERQILSGDATMTREGVVTVISASSAGKIDTTATNPTATYYIPFVENSTATEGDIVHVSSNITVDQAGSFSAVGVTATGNVNAGAALVHDGDSDTRIAFTTDRIKIEAGGVEFFDFLESTSGQDSATFNLDGVDIDFRMLSNNLEAAIHLDAGNDQLVLMGNQDSHVKYFAATGIPGDVNLFMSGTAGSKGTATKGTALFGGDVVISGSLYDAGGNEIVSLGGSALTASLGIESRGDVYVAGNADSTLILESPLMATSRLYGKLAAADPRVNDANTYIDFTDDEIEFYAGSARMLTLREGASDQIIFNEASADINFRVETNNLQAAIYSDGGTDQLAFGANVTDISALSLGTDVNILLSGTIGSKGTSTKGTVVASGDMVVSGTFHNPGIVHVFAQAGGVTNITADTYQPIAFSAETTDTHNSFASSQFTAPYDGYYLINTMVMLNSIDTAADGYRLFVTGSSDVLPRAVMLASFDPDELFPGGDTGAAGVTESNSINGSTTVYMPENSTLQVFIYQAGGTSQTTANRIIGSLGVDGTHVTITKIG